ncbi:MAG: hypothetical protein ABI162_02800 [Luteolibacter sp.]
MDQRDLHSVGSFEVLAMGGSGAAGGAALGILTLLGILAVGAFVGATGSKSSQRSGCVMFLTLPFVILLFFIIGMTQCEEPLKKTPQSAPNPGFGDRDSLTPIVLKVP